MNFGSRKLSRDELNACLVCAESTLETTLVMMREVDRKSNDLNMTDRSYENFRKIYIDLVNLQSNFSKIRGWNMKSDDEDNAKVK